VVLVPAECRTQPCAACGVPNARASAAAACSTFKVLPPVVRHVQGFCMIYDGLGEGPEDAKDRTHFTLKPLGPGQKYSFRIRVGHAHTHPHSHMPVVPQYIASLADPRAPSRLTVHFVGAKSGACTHHYTPSCSVLACLSACPGLQCFNPLGVGNWSLSSTFTTAPSVPAPPAAPQQVQSAPVSPDTQEQGRKCSVWKLHAG
jgi:hypothetical protein